MRKQPAKSKHGEITTAERMSRRALHIGFAAIILYYAFPATVFGVANWVWLVCCVTMPLIVLEFWRLRGRVRFFGLREHERYHFASYFWLANGAVILLIFFPQYIAAPCILAAAIGDPIIGETRFMRRRYAYTVGVLVCFFVFILFRYNILLAAIASLAAFLAESLNIRISWEWRDELFYSRSRRKVSKYKKAFDFFLRSDDDFMMQMVPAVVVYVCVMFFAQNGWTWLIPPEQVLQPLKELAWMK